MQQVKPPFRLFVAAQSWRFMPTSAGLRQQSSAAEDLPLNFSVVAGATAFEDSTTDRLELLFESGFMPQPVFSYQLTADVFAPAAAECSCWQAGNCRLCDTAWTVQVLDDGPMPLATNDALFVGFPLVSELPWLVFANRAPPRATLDISLRFTRAAGVPATALLVSAPVGYEFPYGCLSGPPGSTLQSELPQFVSCIGRLNVAVLTLNFQGLFRPTTVSLRVVTPSTSPLKNMWYVEGRRLEGNIEVGWGSTLGLTSEGLQQVSVEYARLTVLQTGFLVRFTSEVDVNSGGAVTVSPPPGYLLGCANFKPYVMPRTVDQRTQVDCAQNQQGVRISFTNETRLQAGTEYSFVLQGGTAAASTNSSANAFIVQILEQSQQSRVVESNFEVPASQLVSFGAIETPFLVWYDRPTPGAKIWVTFGVRIPQKTAKGLSAMNFGMPEAHTFLFHLDFGTRGAVAPCDPPMPPDDPLR